MYNSKVVSIFLLTMKKISNRTNFVRLLSSNTYKMFWLYANLCIENIFV